MPQVRVPLAIVYDFDGTLAPGNAQEPQFIPDIGMKPEEFWAEVDQFSSAHRADKDGTELDKVIKAYIKHVAVRDALSKLMTAG